MTTLSFCGYIEYLTCGYKKDNLNRKKWLQPLFKL